MHQIAKSKVIQTKYEFQNLTVNPYLLDQMPSYNYNIEHRHLSLTLAKLYRIVGKNLVHARTSP
jgi:hypothetical protein